MKTIRNIAIGFIIGIMLTTTAFAAVQEYTLKQSEWVVVVDGQEVDDERYPVLLMEPGYNYLAAGNFREICTKAGLPFEADPETKEIRITTEQPVAVQSIIIPTLAPTVTPNVVYTEPATIERDGVKKALVSDVYKMLKAKGYEMKNSGKGDFTLYIYDPNNILIFKDVPCLTHNYNGQGVGFIDYDFFVENLKPLIVN